MRDMGVCGGALIAPDIVLFAAHCGKAKNTQVSIGAYKTRSIEGGAQDRFCDRTIFDPEYNDSSTQSDFALCKLNKPVHGITLELNEDGAVPAVGEELRVVGLGLIARSWGALPEYLQELKVPYIDTDVCNSSERYDGKITDEMFCAGYLEGGRDSCQGDSGGPIVRRQEQEDGTFIDTHVGVVSWGASCARENFPGVYARTSSRIDWIKSTACNELGSIASFCGNQIPPSPRPAVECASDEEELLIQVTTDAKGVPSRAILRSTSGSLLNRWYLFREYENNHRVCIKHDEPYVFELGDLVPLCSGGKCGSYRLSVNGKVLASGDGNFTDYFFLYETIQVPSPSMLPSTGPSTLPSISPSFEPSFEPSPEPSYTPSDYPSSLPTVLPSYQPSDQPSEPLVLPAPPLSRTCNDDATFKITKKEQNCGKFVKGGNKALEKRCNRMWKGDFVYDWCPDSCGKKAGIGSCAFLKDVAVNGIDV